MSILFDKFGQPHKLEDVTAVTAIFRLKEKSGSNPWPVIEKIIEIWTSKNPIKWNSYLTYLKEVKETRKVTSVGNHGWRGVSRADRENDGIIVYAVDFPEPVQMWLRAVYTPQELPMNLEFFREFAVRFPRFKVLQRH